MLSLTTKKGSQEFFSYQRVLLFYVKQPTSLFRLKTISLFLGFNIHETVDRL